MSARPSSPLTLLWRKWKALKLPWRKRWLAGTDLVGNTFWYFKPSLSMPQARRIMQNNPKIPYSDLDISPMWHQWLRYTRPTPPSMQEQQTDVIRQIQLKHNAQLADARWAAKPSVLDAPRRGNMELGVGDGEAEGTVGKKWVEGEKTGPGEKKEKPRSGGEKRERQNPWQRDRGIPGEGWQPETWTPGPAKL
ncbi:NADH dehydrogenase [ubiquinone] 1 alpha subcomplex assembly factor 2, partial [Lecanoromycetidae sp. Uapishka_2]